MNKYEKAFEHLREHASFDTVDEMIDIKELVERATPMQPEFNYDEDTYECPCCNKTYETYYDGYLKKFCCECGQALDWRVEDGKTMHI